MLLITAGPKGTRAAGLPSLCTSNFPFARPWPKGSGFSCHLSFVSAAVAARPAGLSKTEGNAWGRVQSLELWVACGCGWRWGCFLPRTWAFCTSGRRGCLSGWLLSAVEGPVKCSLPRGLHHRGCCQWRSQDAAASLSECLPLARPSPRASE